MTFYSFKNRQYKIVVFILALVFAGSRNSYAEYLLTVKYRLTRVDVDQPYFEYLDTAGSSVVKGAWYDNSNQYMVIDLLGTNYHYCGLGAGTWAAFKRAKSFGSAYGDLIKSRFDCRINFVPEYENGFEARAHKE